MDRATKRAVAGFSARIGAVALIATMSGFTGAANAGTRAFLPQVKAVAPPAGAAGLCRSYGWACAAPTRQPLTNAQIKTARRINRVINRKVREISDLHQYGRSEVWALPTARGGDCEDFALAKKRALVEAGLPPERLLIASVLDRSRNPHAVLVLRTGEGDLVLDNLTDRIVGWQATAYTFLRMQDPARPGSWQAVLAGGVIRG